MSPIPATAYWLTTLCLICYALGWVFSRHYYYSSLKRDLEKDFLQVLQEANYFEHLAEREKKRADLIGREHQRLSETHGRDTIQLARQRRRTHDLSHR